jgi:hypothetical protein
LGRLAIGPSSVAPIGEGSEAGYFFPPCDKNDFTPKSILPQKRFSVKKKQFCAA